jgi:hypothetical protein
MLLRSRAGHDEKARLQTDYRGDDAYPRGVTAAAPRISVALRTTPSPCAFGAAEPTERDSIDGREWLVERPIPPLRFDNRPAQMHASSIRRQSG